MIITKYNEYLNDFKKKSIDLIVDGSRKILDFTNEINDIIVNYQDDSDFEYTFRSIQISWMWDVSTTFLKQKANGEIALKMDIDSKNNGIESLEDLKKIIKILSQDEFGVSIRMEFREMRATPGAYTIQKIKEDITNRYPFTMDRFTIIPLKNYPDFNIDIKFKSTDL